MSEDLTTYENSDGHWVSEQEHRRIVAQKDRELELANFTIKECLEKITAMDKAYQQLMAQAIQFAERLDGMDKYSSVRGHDVDDFLKCHEAQAFLREHQS